MKMDIRAAVLTRRNEPWRVLDLHLDDPGPGEVLVRMAFSGLCYSDEHVRLSDQAKFPIIGGHEGAGIVEALGPGVSGIRPGDHVALSFVPVCGHCTWCASGRSNLCTSAANWDTGKMDDGTRRAHGSGAGLGDLGGFAGVGTFATHVVVRQTSCVKIDTEVPLDIAALISCGVLTGWGSAVYAAKVRAGDTVIVYGAGGIGMNAIQGALHAGASNILVVDPTEKKHPLARRLGATQTFSGAEEAAIAAQVVNPEFGGANSAIVATATLRAETVTSAFNAVGRTGTVVIAGLSHDPEEINIQLPGSILAGTEKRIQGTLFGSCNPFADIPRLVRLYQEGRLKLDELVSARYSLDDITVGYEDLRLGKNVRGLIEH